MIEVQRAVEILRAGGVVAFPTETVYGLGADARCQDAVERIFEIKGRPATNPLIVHVANESVGQKFAAHWPNEAHKLASRFWPGPLTLVLQKSNQIVPDVTAGLSTVGLRCPDHPLALELLREVDGPLAAPSANRSTRISPTTAQHVRDELGSAVDLILDGGPCRVGIESTVLDLTGERPVILRPGTVTSQQIAEVVGPLGRAQAISSHGAARSPGQQDVHYAPHATALRFDPSESSRVRKWLSDRTTGAVRWSVLVLDADFGEYLREYPQSAHRFIRMSFDAEEYARNIYGTLRSLDNAGTEVIWIETPPDRPEWVAVRDRIYRATRPGFS